MALSSSSSPVSSSPSKSANSILPALHHALSGSLGTLVSTCSLYPLSLVIARLQVQRQLQLRRQRQQRRRRGGAKDPTRAPGPDLRNRDHPDHGPSTPTQSPTQTPAQIQNQTPIPPARTSPPLPRDQDQVDTPQERQGQVQQQQTPATDGDHQSDPQPRRPTAEYAGIVDAFWQIWSSSGDGGLRAFYTGLAQDAPKSVLDSFLFFLFYEWFRALRLRSRRRSGRSKGRSLGVLEELAVGMAAGACSRSFTTPIANVVTRKQTATVLSPDKNPSVREIARSIREEKGIAGFWSGYSASLVLTLNPSLTFFLQEFLKGTFAEQKYDDLDPWLTFLFAASSKAVSSLVTYPFQIAKTRLQAGVPLDPEEEEQPEEINGTDSRTEELIKAEEAAETKPKAVRAVQALAQRSIFGTVADIIRTEGIGSLYDGVGAELLKGFFNHGTTMLAKDVVHKFLFKLYIFALGFLAEPRKRQRSKTITLPQRNALLRVLLFHRRGRAG
ncbi:mitochondrial carrier domain-containing protein [Xylaria arbuscula]|nr:mitochondrial carrier domain-containing protein [Xylaria arbuscula]